MHTLAGQASAGLQRHHLALLLEGSKLAARVETRRRNFDPGSMYRRYVWTIEPRDSGRHELETGFSVSSQYVCAMTIPGSAELRVRRRALATWLTVTVSIRVEAGTYWWVRLGVPES